MITDDMLKEICDKVENSLENYVLEHRGQLLEDGKIIEGEMEGQIRNQYEFRLSGIILAKGEDIKSLSEKQNKYIRNRINDTLELSKKQYES
jgi:phosphoenolpyruvate-protein kinase (PTS system EI component)